MFIHAIMLPVVVSSFYNKLKLSLPAWRTERLFKRKAIKLQIKYRQINELQFNFHFQMYMSCG